MFELLKVQSRSAAGAILYVTVGTLLMIWSVLTYYYFLMDNPSAPAWQNFLCIGTILSGFAIASIGLLFGLIGLLFGLIGRGAKGADNAVGVAPVGPVVATGIPTAGVVGSPAVVATPMTTAPVNTGMR